MLQRTVDRLDIPAEVVNIDYGTIKMTEHPCDLKTFTHSIYYFEGNWATLAREAFSTIRPGGSLVFTLNGDEGGSAAMIDHLSHLGYSGLSKLDISGFIDSCAAMEGISLAVYRVPLKIPNQHDSEFLVHMARIFLEDLRTPIDSDAVRAYLKMTKNQLDFVDKVIELKPETGHARTEPDD
jgi:hypothetical protein